MGETGKSKARRKFIFYFLAVIAAVVIVPFAAWAGAGVAQASGSVNVLTPQSTVINIYAPNGTALAFASSFGAYRWTMPTGLTFAYVSTGMTMGEMQAHSVNQLTVIGGYPHPGNVTLGFGATVASFVPYELVQGNLTSVALPVSTAFLTGNGSEPLMLELHSAAVSYNASFSAQGASGLSQWFGPAAAEDMGYIIGGILVIALATAAIPWYDLDVRKVGEMTIGRFRRSPKQRTRAKGG